MYPFFCDFFFRQIFVKCFSQFEWFVIQCEITALEDLARMTRTSVIYLLQDHPAPI